MTVEQLAKELRAVWESGPYRHEDTFKRVAKRAIDLLTRGLSEDEINEVALGGKVPADETFTKDELREIIDNATDPYDGAIGYDLIFKRLGGKVPAETSKQPAREDCTCITQVITGATLAGDDVEDFKRWRQDGKRDAIKWTSWHEGDEVPKLASEWHRFQYYNIHSKAFTDLYSVWKPCLITHYRIIDCSPPEPEMPKMCPTCGHSMAGE